MVLLNCIIIILTPACGRLITPQNQALPTRPVAVAPTATPTVTVTATPTQIVPPTATLEPATPAPTPTPTITPTPVIYVVQPGDTLLSIAIAYDVAVEAIQTANGIVDPRLLQIGQVVVIPDAADDGSLPSPTPTPFPALVQGISFQRLPQGSLWAFGTVKNPGDVVLSEIVVEVNLYDPAGILLDSKAVFAQLDLLRPGGEIPFAALFVDPPSSFAQFQAITISAVPILGQTRYYVDFEALELSARFVEDGLYRVKGQLANTGQHDVEAIKLVTTAFDVDNQVVGQRQAALDVILLRSGSRTPFEVDLIIPEATVHRYTIQAEGLRTP
ncbi:MAG: FxLYD domain-containing protein [Chloroflexota bacterium]